MVARGFDSPGGHCVLNWVRDGCVAIVCWYGLARHDS